MAALDVLLPFWGDVGYLKAAVTSVLAQSEADWRLVVVDDGYPSEEPAAWIASLADQRIEYHRNPENLGANANYRRALEFASAPWLVVMGADDVMRPNYLQVVLNAAARHQVDVIQPGVEVIDAADRVYRPLADRVKGWYAPRLDGGEVVLSGEPMARSLLRADWAYFPSLAWRRETIQRIGFRPGLHVVQDLALLLDVAAEGGSMLVLGEIAFSYRRHTDSDSSVKAVNGVRFDEERDFFRASAARFAALGWTRAARAGRWHLSSRLNAATLLPTAVRVGGGASGNLLRHVVG